MVASLRGEIGFGDGRQGQNKCGDREKEGERRPFAREEEHGGILQSNEAVCAGWVLSGERRKEEGNELGQREIGPAKDAGEGGLTKQRRTGMFTLL